MDKEQIIQMARDSGLEIDESGDIDNKQIWYFVFDDLKRFAAAIRAATKDEDAKICEEIEARARKEWRSNYNQLDQGIEFGAVQCAYSILLSK